MDREVYDKSFVNVGAEILSDFDVFEACLFDACQWAGADLSKKKFVDCNL